MNDRARKTMPGRLSRADWIAAGMTMLAESGIQSVRVEALARRLGVTKGSFYWHFRDLSALAAAMLDAWERESTSAVVARMEAGGGDAGARLLRLLRIVVERDGRIDQAIRAWAAAEETTAVRLEAVDRRRLGLLHDLFAQMGFDDPSARARARLVYTSMIGDHAVRVKLDIEERLKLAEMNHAMLTTRPERQPSPKGWTGAGGRHARSVGPPGPDKAE